MGDIFSLSVHASVVHASVQNIDSFTRQPDELISLQQTFQKKDGFTHIMTSVCDLNVRARIDDIGSTNHILGDTDR